jgi:hypothetical protein
MSKIKQVFVGLEIWAMFFGFGQEDTGLWCCSVIKLRFERRLVKLLKISRNEPKLAEISRN